MAGIAISALLLCVIMFVVARHEADYSLPKVLMVSAGISIVSLLLSMAIGLLAVPVIIGLTMWALHEFCFLRWSRAAIVTGIYIACQIGISLALRRPAA
jgi:hypothetical protein